MNCFATNNNSSLYFKVTKAATMEFKWRKSKKSKQKDLNDSSTEYSHMISNFNSLKYSTL